MNSLLPTEQTTPLVFFNICLLLIMYTLMKKALRPPYVVAVSSRNFTFLLMFVFVLFSFWGSDWFGYQLSFKSLKSGYAGHMEDVYVWIAQNLSPNYLMFRFVVWGGSLCLLLHMFNRLTIPKFLAVFFFCTIYIIWFSYARVTAAMVLVYYGLIVLYKPYKNKLLSIILGITAICSAFFFHKSALFGIASAVITIFVNKFEKRFFILLLFCYPILLYLAQSNIGVFLMSDMSGEYGGFEAGMAVGQSYLNEDLSKRGLGGLIQQFLEISPHYLLAFISLIFIRSKYYMNAPNDIKAFIRLQFFIILLSSVFMFDLGVNTQVVFSRFSRFSVIPSCIVLTYYYSIKYKHKYVKFTYYLAFMGTIYALVYSMYNTYVG